MYYKENDMQEKASFPIWIGIDVSKDSFTAACRSILRGDETVFPPQGGFAIERKSVKEFMRWAAGVADGSQVLWQEVGSVADFAAPKERFAEVGRTFPVSMRDVVPVNYPVTVCGKGRLVLADVDEMLERVEGNGLIQLEHATIAFPPKTTFAGSVCGGDVK